MNDQAMVEKVGDALRAACLREFDASWSFDVAWRFAQVAIDTIAAEQNRRDAELGFGLTIKQSECLQFIKGYIEDHGIAPSIKEIKDSLSLHSTSGVHRMVRALEERGHISTIPHRVRSIKLLEAA